MAHPIYKGPRERWFYWLGLLRLPTAEDELSDEEKAVLAYLKKSGGAKERSKMYEETHADPKVINRLQNEGLIWVHATRKSVSGALPHGESITVVPGIPIPDGPDRVTVTDEDSYARSLELMARGPVLISTKYKVYQIDEFDQAAEIVSDQLVEHGYALVEVVKPKAIPPSKSTLSTPIAKLPGESQMVHVVDDKSFEKALELVTRGPVTITAKNLRYTNMADFDKVAERLIYLLNIGYQPWVDGRPIY